MGLSGGDPAPWMESPPWGSLTGSSGLVIWSGLVGSSKTWSAGLAGPAGCLAAVPAVSCPLGVVAGALVAADGLVTGTLPREIILGACCCCFCCCCPWRRRCCLAQDWGQSERVWPRAPHPRHLGCLPFTITRKQCPSFVWIRCGICGRVPRAVSTRRVRTPVCVPFSS